MIGAYYLEETLPAAEASCCKCLDRGCVKIVIINIVINLRLCTLDFVQRIAQMQKLSCIPIENLGQVRVVLLRLCARSRDSNYY